jgi:hypothetical protein
MDVLKNNRHERFCQLVAGSGEKTESFVQVYPRARHWKQKRKCNRASEMAVMLKDRIRELQRISAKNTIASRDEIAEFLTRIIRTPIANIDDTSPLMQEKHTRTTKSATIESIRMPDKLSAAAQLAKMMGYNVPEKAEDHFTFQPDQAVMEKLGASTMIRHESAGASCVA